MKEATAPEVNIILQQGIKQHQLEAENKIIASVVPFHTEPFHLTAIFLMSEKWA